MSTETNAPAALGAPAEGEAAATEETIVSTVEGTTPEDETEPEGEPVEPSDDDDEQEDDGKPRKQSRTKRLQAKVRELSIQLENEQRRNGASAQQDLTPPSEADFNGDYAAFERAQRQYDVKMVLRQERAADDQRAIDAKNRELSTERASLYRERAAEAKAAIPDFDKVLETVRTAPVRDDIADFIQESEKGPHLAYHLAKNPDQLRDLNSIPPAQAMRELARIEARLSIPASKKQTTAPPPVRPVSGGARPSPTPGKTMSDYERWRNSEG